MVVRQLEAGRHEVENQYARSVRRGGNRPAQEIIAEVYEVCDRPWRGLGVLPRSGLRLTAAYRDLDAEARFAVASIRAVEPPECRSGEVLQGLHPPRTSARRSARSAPPTTPSGPRWSRARGRARPTGSTAGLRQGAVQPVEVPAMTTDSRTIPDGPGPLLSRAPAARGPRPAGPRRGGAADAPPDPRGLARGLRQRVPAAAGRRGGAAGDRGPRGPDDRQLRRQPARSSPAATSASWPCTGRSTTWPSAGPSRCT